MTSTPSYVTVQATVDKRVEQFIQVRDRIKEIEAETNEKLKPLREIQNLLSGWIMDFLDKAGAQNIKTAHGTCGTTTRYTSSLADPDAFMKFVIDNKLFELLDRRANAQAVKDYVGEKGHLPPGCNLNAMKSVSVRRA